MQSQKEIYKTMIFLDLGDTSKKDNKIYLYHLSWLISKVVINIVCLMFMLGGASKMPVRKKLAEEGGFPSPLTEFLCE